MCSEEENKKHDEAKTFDPSFRGPISDRSCTDVICCIFFVAFLCSWGVLSYFAFTTGNPERLLYPTDSDGNICGVNNVASEMDLTSKPYLFFFDLTKCASASSLSAQCPTPQVCVSSCPADYYSIYTETNTSYWVCTYDFDIDAAQLEIDSFRSLDITALYSYVTDLVDSETCASYYVEEETVVDRCIPSIFVTAVSSFESVIIDGDNATLNLADLIDGMGGLEYVLEAQEIAVKIFEDFTDSWKFMLIGSAVGAVFAFVFIFIMRWFAGIMIWLLILAFFLLLGVGTYLSVDQYIYYDDLTTTTNSSSELSYNFYSQLSVSVNMVNFWLGTSITIAVVWVVFFLLTLCLCNRIKIAIELIKEGSRAIGYMMFTLIFPLFPFIGQLAVFSFFVVVALYLASNDTVTYMLYNSTSGEWGAECNNTNATVENMTCTFYGYGVNEFLTYMQFYNLFGFYWLSNFVMAVGQCTLAGAFASYFWAFTKPDDIVAFPILKALWRCFRYHMGSLAFGSLILAIVQIIRAILSYVERQLKGKDNKVTKFLLKCLICCFWCLEKIIKFINKNAYILIAIYGKNFCASAKDAFFLLLRNIVRVAVLNGITSFLLFIGKMVVVAAITTLSYFFFTGQISIISDYVPSLNYYYVPLIFIGITTYIVASLFFDVYDMCVDVLFLCFLEDLERHDGTAEKPYYMSKELMKICGVKNKSEVEKARGSGGCFGFCCC